MTLEQYYFIAEIIGVVAIVFSLLFVGVQLRQNTLATRATSHHAITDAMNQVNQNVIQNEGFTHIWLKGSMDRASLTNEQRTRFDSQLLSYFHVFDTMYYQASVGAGDLGLLESEGPGIASMFARPGVEDWWNANLFGLSQEFRDYIKTLLAEHPPANF